MKTKSIYRQHLLLPVDVSPKLTLRELHIIYQSLHITEYFHHALNIFVYIIFEKARDIKYNFWNFKLMLLQEKSI